MTPTTDRTTTALLATALLHGALLAVAMLLRLPDPPIDRGPIALYLTPETLAPRRPPASAESLPAPVEGSTASRESGYRQRTPRAMPNASADAAPGHVDVPGAPVSPDTDRHTTREPQTNIKSESLKNSKQIADPSKQQASAGLRSVLERPLTTEEAWSILERLMEEHPRYRGLVLREMIAGSGLPVDSVPRIDLRYDSVFRNGIRPSWGAQRHVIEDAFKSFDAVHGWTNKGGYGPTINVIGLIRFLIDLIEGE